MSMMLAPLQLLVLLAGLMVVGSADDRQERLGPGSMLANLAQELIARSGTSSQVNLSLMDKSHVQMDGA